MTDLYFSHTPNGFSAQPVLEKAGLAYRARLFAATHATELGATA